MAESGTEGKAKAAGVGKRIREINGRIELLRKELDELRVERAKLRDVREERQKQREAKAASTSDQ